MVLSGFTLNDAFILFAFMFSSSEIFVTWSSFAACQKPIHYWLVGSYIACIAFRLSHYFGQYLSDDGNEEIMFYRQRGPPFWVNVLILAVLFPSFTGWTVVGTVWFVEIQSKTPFCLPSESHQWFFTFWLAMCYIWIVVYAAFIVSAAVFEYRARRMEADLRILQNEDRIRRWGQLRFFSEYGIYIFRRGLTTDQIRKLPSQTLKSEPFEMVPCSICLEEFAVHDNVRVLQACGHIFHKSCIDIWLIRNAVCPNCKSPICVTSTCCGRPTEGSEHEAETRTSTPGRSITEGEPQGACHV